MVSIWFLFEVTPKQFSGSPPEQFSSFGYTKFMKLCFGKDVCLCTVLYPFAMGKEMGTMGLRWTVYIDTSASVADTFLVRLPMIQAILSIRDETGSSHGAEACLCNFLLVSPRLKFAVHRGVADMGAGLSRMFNLTGKPTGDMWFFPDPGGAIFLYSQ